MELIDFDEFMTHLDDFGADVIEDDGCLYTYFGFSRERLREVAKKAKAVDAVEVVRCKDCTFWSDEDGIREDENTGKRFSRCKIHNTMQTCWCPYEDDFCSCGEKRENE